MRTEYPVINRFRLVAAFLIVAIHTAPLSSLNADADFLFTHVFTRIAVPFFLMVTGYFLAASLRAKRSNPAFVRFIKRTSLIYLGATLLYLPISIYAGHYDNGFIPVLMLRNILFDGTFYHLWYLPASVIGVLFIYALGRRFSLRTILWIAAFLYVFGLLGDSYYGLVARVPFLHALYDAGFHIFSYTRNGLFYAPLFLVMGTMMAKANVKLSTRASLIGFILSMAFMLAEGMALHHFHFQRHDSMYIALPFCLFFLFSLLLTQKGKTSLLLRDISLWIYLLHPLFIIVVRGIARAFRLTGLLVDNSVVHYLSVCLLSFLAAVFISLLSQQWQAFRTAAAFQTGRAFIELDMKNLRHNVNVLKNRLPDGCRLMPALKANAYGHGMIPVARELSNCGIRSFCVATVREGVELRKHHIRGEILILGRTEPEQFPLLRRYRLTQTVIDHDYAVLLNRFGKKLSVHVKIDTGMHRLGERAENREQIKKIFSYRNLAVAGIYTHLCTIDGGHEKDKIYAQMQIDHFRDALSFLKGIPGPRPKTHLHSSYGIFSDFENGYDFARAGIALYGMLSHGGDAEKLETGLLPVLSLKARISMIKTLCAGESAGYGLAFTAPCDMRIAILPIGYADGIPRTLSVNGGYVLISGRKAPIIGRICMDQMTVDVTLIAHVKSGDVAVLIGKSGEASVTAGEIAGQAGTITNEIVSRLGARLARVIV